MAEIGRLNKLAVVRESLAGVYLDGGALGEILLPKARQSELAAQVEVFIYPAADKSLVATTKRPFAQGGEFAWLVVSEVNQIGAFLDWGLDKELLLPFAEQKYEPKVGLRVMVRVYSNRWDDPIFCGSFWKCEPIMYRIISVNENIIIISKQNWLACLNHDLPALHR